jgi:hypothetical protein
MSCCRNLIGNLPPSAGNGGNGNGGSLYPDPWEALAGDEIFSDNFDSFSGWTVYNDFDQTSTPTIDTAASVFRAIGNNPVIDSSTRDNGLIVMPENNTSNLISISRDISSLLPSPGGPWLMMAKISIPNHRVIINNSISAAIGFSLPASNNLQYNSVEIYALEQDPGLSGIQCQRWDNAVVGNISEFNMSPNPAFPCTVWLFMYHENASSDVVCFWSIDGGRTLNELGTVTKDPSTFTHFYFACSSIAQMTTYPQIGIEYCRIYDSLKQR